MNTSIIYEKVGRLEFRTRHTTRDIAVDYR